MTKTTDILPIFGPLIALARSRKGLLWIATAAAALLIAYLPAFEEVRAQLIEVGLIVFGMITSFLVVAIGWEDAQTKRAGQFPVRLEQVDFMPIISPLVALLRSRKAIAWLATLIVGFLVTNLPDLEEVQPQLVEIFAVVFGVITSALFSSIAIEDGASKAPATNNQNGALVDMVVAAVLAGLSNKDEPIAATGRLGVYPVAPDSPSGRRTGS